MPEPLALHHTPFARTVLELEQKAGRGPIEIAVIRTSTTARWTGRRIEVSADLLATPKNYQQWLAAHELAHAALRHGKPRWWFWPALTLVGVLMLGGGPLLDVLDVHGRAAVLVFSTTTGLSLATLVLAMWRMSIGKWPQETAADQLALSWGYPLTSGIAARLCEEEGAGGPRWLRFLRQHPPPDDRVNG